MNNVDKILEKIRAQGEAKASQIRERADAEIAELNAQCESDLRDMRLKNAAKCEKEREIILRRAQSSIAMRRREIMLGARVGLLDKAYAEAEKFFAEMDRDAYAALLSRLLANALADRLLEEHALSECGEESSGGEFAVAFNKKDRNELGKAVIKDALAMLSGHVEKAPAVKLSEHAEQIGGGFILRSADVECDCSIHTLVTASRSSTEAEAAQVLFQ